MRPIEWVNKLLKRHGLKKPDGRPLYQYRVTELEFQELEELLKLSAMMGFVNISRMLMWDSVMVFYASEWWRRYYSGQWTWDGIFQSVNIDIEEISTSRRNEVVELGLHRWQRTIRRIDYRRQFLGTVATEGGLPLNRLKDAGGWLNGVLRPVISKHLSRGIDIHDLLDTYSDSIPKSYRSTEIIEILVDLVDCVSSLRRKHNFLDKSDPTTWLDQQEPNWREAFPLPVENDVAKALLSDLIKDAAKSKILDTSNADNLFNLERFLINVSTSPEVKATLRIPSFISQKSLSLINKEELPAKLDFELNNDFGKSWNLCRAFKTVKNDETFFKLIGKSIVMLGENALAELSLIVKSEGQVLGKIPIADSQRIERDEPWLFKEIADNWELQGSASQKTKDEKAIVYIPEVFEKITEDSTELKILKEAYDGSFYSLIGSVSCKESVDKASFVLSTKAEDSYLQYDLEGKEYEWSSNPKRVFVGVPQLIIRNTITGNVTKKISYKLRVKSFGIESEWKKLTGDEVGVYDLRLLDESGSILYKRRVGLFPEGFSLQLEADKKNARKGKAILNGLPELDLNIQHHEVNGHKRYENMQYIFSVEAPSIPPRSFPISFLPKFHRHEITLTIPFPSKGAALYNPDGKVVKKGSNLYLNNLYGYRLKVFNDPKINFNSAQLRFNLNDERLDLSELRDVYINKNINLKDTITEVALIDWFDIFQEMLGISSNIDSCVIVSLIINGQEVMAINIYRYDCNLIPDWQAGTLSINKGNLNYLSSEKSSAVNIETVLLNQPEQKSHDIVSLKSEGVDTGLWDFQLDKRPKGPWLIFPGLESPISFRPLIWNVNYDIEIDEKINFDNINSLQKAILINEYKLRESALKSVMHQMALDLQHQGWSYLRSLNDKCSHLPLVTFDIWRLAISNPSFLTILFIKSEFDDVVERFESELPIIWELVSIKEWERALNIYKNYLIDKMCLGDIETNKSIYEVIIQLVLNVINKIEGLGSSMHSICIILKFTILNIKEKEISIFQQPLNGLLQTMIESSFQNLRRRNSESKWPVMLQHKIKVKAELLPIQLKNILNSDNDFEKSITYLPSILASHLSDDEDYDWLGNEVTIFKLKQLKNFDEHWFSTNFRLLSGWLYFYTKNNEK
jgi:hypothetical protein